MRSSFATRSPEGPGSAAWLPIGPCWWVLCPSVGSDKGTADAAISAAKDNATAEVEQLFLKVIAILLGWRRARASRRRLVNRMPMGRFQLVPRENLPRSETSTSELDLDL